MNNYKIFIPLLITVLVMGPFNYLGASIYLFYFKYTFNSNYRKRLSHAPPNFHFRRKFRWGGMTRYNKKFKKNKS